MTLESTRIIDHILDFFKKHHYKQHSDFYVGITNDINIRLQQHKVDFNYASQYTQTKALSIDCARRAESYLIEQFGFKGGKGGGNNTSYYVYCYLITPNTIE